MLTKARRNKKSGTKSKEENNGMIEHKNIRNYYILNLLKFKKDKRC